MFLYSLGLLAGSGRWVKMTSYLCGATRRRSPLNLHSFPFLFSHLLCRSSSISNLPTYSCSDQHWFNCNHNVLILINAINLNVSLMLFEKIDCWFEEKMFLLSDCGVECVVKRTPGMEASNKFTFHPIIAISSNSLIGARAHRERQSRAPLTHQLLGHATIRLRVKFLSNFRCNEEPSRHQEHSCSINL